MNLYECFFNPDKVFTPQKVQTGVVNGRVADITKMEDDREKTDPFEGTGTDYARQYQQQELATYQDVTLRSINSLSNVETAHDLIPPEEIEEIRRTKAEDMNRVYNLYKFNTRTRMTALPIDDYRDAIIGMLSASSTIIIHGQTGCGKTTQVPQYILDHCKETNQYCNIVVTQPRRIAAISVSKRVCEERGWSLASVCGYQVGLDRATSQDTILSYVTTGVLLQKLAKKKHLNEYSHIIIDEVHERTQEMDFLLLLIRRFLYTNSPDVKVILMSATFDTDKFGLYFSTHNAGQQLPAPTIFITKESHFRKNFYYIDQLSTLGAIPEFKFEEPRIKQELYVMLVKLIKIFDRLDVKVPGTDKVTIGHVLVFLPGLYEIEEAYSHLDGQRRLEVSDIKWLILPLHSSITNHEQRKVFITPAENHRKIILSTNIAESSITVTDVEYVIDFCLTKTMVVDPSTQYQSLKLEWASKVNCIQRSGRVGRVRDGRIYRMVPQTFYENFLPNDIVPEMLIAPLERIVLCSKLLEIHEAPKAILALAIDPPALENIESTIFNLKEAGALLITTKGEIMKSNGDLTFLGRVMANLPLDVKLSKLICLGYLFSCFEECIIMAAGCSLSNIFSNPFQEKLKAYINRLMWADGSCSDLLAYLNLYRVWERNRGTVFRETRDLTAWCKNNYLSYRSLKEWEILVTEIRDRLSHMGLKESVGPARVTLGHLDFPLVLKVVISGAFYPNYFQRSNECGQVIEREAVKMLNGLNPMQTVYFTNMDSAQPGPLYNKRIKDMLGACSNNMKVYFSGSSKMFVTFGLNQEQHTIDIDGRKYVAVIPGKVAFEVYKAVRLRQTGCKTLLYVMRPKDAWRRAKDVGIAHRTDFGSYAIIQPVKQQSTFLPGIGDLTLSIRITCVVNAGNFYAQPTTDEIDENLSLIDGILNCQSQVLRPLIMAPTIGHLYAAMFPDDHRYYRCRLISLSPHKRDEVMAQVCFVDFGNTVLLPKSALRTLPTGPAKELSPLAMECVLSEVQPSVILNPKALWTKEADNVLKASMDTVLTAKVYSVVDDIVSMELYRPGGKVSVNDYLISKGYAQKCEESYLSKDNHNKRERAQNYNDPGPTHDNGILICTDNDVDPPAISECPHRINLKGPFSPLEMSVYSFFDTQKVVIDGNSVNAVLLDSEPQDHHDRLMAAFNVSQSPHSSTLTLRHATLMPNIHGFGALMGLLFAPRMVPKPVEDGTALSSFLFGLGENPLTGNPLYPVHDMLMSLDTEISREDLVQINELRYWMNNTVSAMEMIHNNMNPSTDINTCQGEIKKRLIDLLERTRPAQERKVIRNGNSWHKFMYNGERLYPGNISKCNDIWPLHWTMKLMKEDKEYTEQVQNVEMIRDMAKSIKPISEMTCILCDETLTTVEEMRLHLASPLHRIKEETLVKRKSHHN